MNSLFHWRKIRSEKPRNIDSVITAPFFSLFFFSHCFFTHCFFSYFFFSYWFCLLFFFTVSTKNLCVELIYPILKGIIEFMYVEELFLWTKVLYPNRNFLLWRLLKVLEFGPNPDAILNRVAKMYPFESYSDQFVDLFRVNIWYSDFRHPRTTKSCLISLILYLHWMLEKPKDFHWNIH